MSMIDVDIVIELTDEELLDVDIWVPDPAAVGPPIDTGGQPLWNDGQWNEGTW